MRIFNRSAQRYLVRRATPLPVVGIPGADLALSSDWIVADGDEPVSHHIRTPRSSGGILVARAGALSMERPEAAKDPESGWRLESAGDGSDYRYIVSAADTTRGLVVDAGPHGAGSDLEVRLGAVSPGDRNSMWLLQEECVADARSVHLRYGAPNQLALFYNEIAPGDAPPGTFFCTSGFGVDARGPDPGGYAGIQTLADGSRIAIFSVWHRLIDDERPVPDARATAVSVNPGAYETPFTGEGSGTSIRLPLDWRVSGDQSIRFVVTAELIGDDTVLCAYLARGSEAWINIGAITRSGTGARLISRPYAFIEDFARTGNADDIAAAERSPYRVRSARFANPWFVADGGSPAPATQIDVTAYSPHPLESLAAEPVAPFGVYLATGTAAADRPPPIGATFNDLQPQDRVRPDLGGVPYA